jgi:hypothetical protein
MTNEQPAPQTPPTTSKPKEEWTPKLLPRGYGKLTPEEYISERINQEIAYYNKTAGKYKNRYLQMRAITVIGGALVPVLVNVHLPYVDIVTTIISLAVVLLVSLESVYHYREQWTNYRSAEQNLRNEYFLFTTKSGRYATYSEEAAFSLFVDRVEEEIDAENASTLRVMSTVTEAKTTATIENQPVIKPAVQ